VQALLAALDLKARAVRKLCLLITQENLAFHELWGLKNGALLKTSTSEPEQLESFASYPNQIPIKPLS